MAEGEESPQLGSGGSAVSVSGVDLAMGDSGTVSEGSSLPSGTETQQLFHQFMERKQTSLQEALSFLLSRRFIVDIVYTEISSQLHGEKPDPTVFQWIYECVTSEDEGLRKYALQFVPDLVMVYLLAVTDNIAQVAALAEIALRGVSELNKQVQQRVECPSLAKPSVYHEPRVALPTMQPLTESALMRHDLNEKQPPPPDFRGQTIVASNRLSFLASVITLCARYMLDLPDKARQDYCHLCTRVCVRGIHSIEHMEGSYEGDCVSKEELVSLQQQRRVRLDCELLSSLLQGIKKCIFRSSHCPAKQALLAAKFRAEYEQLPQATLISRALVRVSEGVHPQSTVPDPSILKMFVGKDINLTTIQNYFNSVAIHGDKMNVFQRSASTKQRLRLGNETQATETEV